MVLIKNKNTRKATFLTDGKDHQAGVSVGIIGGLSDGKFCSKTMPLVELTAIRDVYLFRYNGNPLKQSDKVKILTCFESIKIPRRIFDCIYLIYFTILCMFKKVDVLVGIYFFPHGMIAGLLGFIFRVPVIQVTTGTDLKKLKSNIFLKILNLGRFIGVRGDESKHRLVKLGINQEKIFILNNFFTEDTIHLPAQAAEKEYDLISVGYLRPLKRIDILLNVVRKLKEDNPSIKCLIAGDGPSKHDLMEMSSDLGLEENVIFSGHVKDVIPLLGKAKVFTMTSESEGLPMAMIEAMACGLPVVVPNIDDIPTIVENGCNGFLINSSIMDDYYDHCRILLTDYELRERMGNHSLNSIQKLYKSSFSFEAVSKVWKNKIENIESSR